MIKLAHSPCAKMDKKVHTTVLHHYYENCRLVYRRSCVQKKKWTAVVGPCPYKCTKGATFVFIHNPIFKATWQCKQRKSAAAQPPRKKILQTGNLT